MVCVNASVYEEGSRQLVTGVAATNDLKGKEQQSETWEYIRLSVIKEDTLQDCYSRTSFDFGIS